MKLKVSRILHAGYVFECGETRIAFDPIFENPFSRNCYAFPSVEFDQKQIRALRLDAVFISHYHDDHCSLESLNLLDRQTPIYLYCLYEELFAWIRELGFKNVYSLELNQTVSVGEFEIIPRRALDSDVDSIFHLKAAGLNVLNVVDSWIDSPTLALLAQSSPWDLVLWPFQTMRELEVLSPSRAQPAPEHLPPEWIEQLKILNPKFIIASSCQFLQESWSWYNHAFFPVSYLKFQKEVESQLSQSQVIRLDPSRSFEIDFQGISPSAPLSWIQPLGEQNVDYEYIEGYRAPPTSEIAKHFPALTAHASDEVDAYCREGLLAKYQSLEPSEDPYFGQSRHWRLSVYDHRGQVRRYDYLLGSDSRIELVPESQHPLAWTTEVPAAKLYAALKAGESLTSMYIRINDSIFKEEIEAQLQSVEIVEDPLIRCLFTGAFGSFQKAQLERLKMRGETAKSQE